MGVSGWGLYRAFIFGEQVVFVCLKCLERQVRLEPRRSMRILITDSEL